MGEDVTGRVFFCLVLLIKNETSEGIAEPPYFP